MQHPCSLIMSVTYAGCERLYQLGLLESARRQVMVLRTVRPQDASNLSSICMQLVRCAMQRPQGGTFVRY